jgi:hypothetical protein
MIHGSRFVKKVCELYAGIALGARFNVPFSRKREKGTDVVKIISLGWERLGCQALSF